jgi:hypothetical protein
MTRRHKVLNAIKARLETILITNGYATNAGQRVRYGVTVVDDPKPAGLPLVHFIGGETESLQEGSRALMQMDIAIVGLTTVNEDDELAALEPLLGDLEKAIFAAPQQLADGGGAVVSDVEFVKMAAMDRELGDLVGRVGMTVRTKWMQAIGAPDVL